MLLEEYLSVPDAARELGVSKVALYEAIREGRLPSEMVFSRRVVRRADVLAYKERTAGVGPKGGRPKAPRRPVGRPRKSQD